MKDNQHWRRNLLLPVIGFGIFGLSFVSSGGAATTVEVSQLEFKQETFLTPLRELDKKLNASSSYEYYCGPGYYGPVSTMGGWHYPTYRSIGYRDASPNDPMRLRLLVAHGA